MKFVDANGSGPGVRLGGAQQKKGYRARGATRRGRDGQSAGVAVSESVPKQTPRSRASTQTSELRRPIAKVVAEKGLVATDIGVPSIAWN